MHVPRCVIATGSGLAYTLLERMLLDGALTGSWRYRVPYESGAVPRQSFADCIPAPAILAELAYVVQLPIARIIMFAYAVVSMLLSMFFATARTHRHICPAVKKPVLRFCPFVVCHGGLGHGDGFYDPWVGRVNLLGSSPQGRGPKLCTADFAR